MESERFNVNSGVRCGFFISPRVNLYLYGVMKDFKVRVAGKSVRLMLNNRDIRVPFLCIYCMQIIWFGGVNIKKL